MSEDEAMNIDQNELQKLQTLTNGPLASSFAKLLNISRTIPSERDFHFYNNFPEIKLPVKEITQKSQSLLKSIGSKGEIWEKDSEFPVDFDDAYDWLVNVNDEVFERFDVSVDEFKRIRKVEEESGKRIMESADGFQVVCNKKKKKNKGELDLVSCDGDTVNGTERSGVKVASLRDKKVVGVKPKVSFHIPTIRKPQDEYNIFVNNANKPFEHVWLPRSEDGQRGVHPMEELSFLDFVDRSISNDEPVKPQSIEDTPFKLVQDVKELKELAATLRNVDEFGVDLEHNHYRSFQGLTCLMQISTRTEDFVVDTLKLRIHVGPYLRQVFKDPTKRKVMHGADRDILWLQRDFSIYVCNLFDTGQASRVLKLGRNSLEHLLHQFCGVTAKKEYQNADWRLRPLPDEMLRYAREDTHYLLHIYDLMKIKLITMSEESGSGNSTDALVEVYKRSSDVCMQLYEKEPLTENSYQHVYGLQGAGFDAQQVAIVAGLYGWRDAVARAEDESTGYILPNKMLLEIAKQMPLSAGKLRRMLRMRHPYVERNLSTVVDIILHSMQNAAAFEDAAEHLKEKRTETVPEENLLALDGPEALGSEPQPDLDTENVGIEDTKTNSSSEYALSIQKPVSEELLEFVKTPNSGSNPRVEGFASEDSLKRRIESNRNVSENSPATDNRNANPNNKVSTVSIQAVKKPAGAFGALLGNSASKRKSVAGNEDKKEVKLEQIRYSVSLPFHSFMGFEKQEVAKVDEPTTQSRHEHDLSAVPPSTSTVEDIILLKGNSSSDEPVEDESESTAVAGGNESDRAALEMDKEEDTTTLNDLSSSFKKCFQSINESRKAGRKEKIPEAGHFLQLKPFDYEAARSEVRFGETEEELEDGDEKGLKSLSKSQRKKSSSIREAPGDDGNRPIPQGRRRQAFPATGNRSATFR